MKKRTWIFIIAAALALLAIIVLLVLNLSSHPVRKVEGVIPYNPNNLYMPYGGSLFEISDDGMITEYSISYEYGYETKMSIQKTGPFRVNLPVKKYISSDLFITEDDGIMFGDIKGTEHKKLGTVKNAADISILRQNKVLMRTAVVTSDGLLFVQGDNSTGALGIETKQVNNEFVQVPYLQNVAKAVCGINCIFVLNTDGEVFLSGTLGNLSYQTFTKLEVPEKAKDIEASNHSETLIALGVDGNVYEMGISFFEKSYYDDELSYSPHAEFYSSFQKISKLKDIIFITSSGAAACALDKNGKVFYWGAEMIGKSTEFRKFFKYLYKLPKYNDIWLDGYFYVLSGNEITVYSW